MSTILQPDASAISSIPKPGAFLNYALIGNCQINALISQKGAIEWSCMPAFDSPSVFGSLLDDENGGMFWLVPDGIYTTEQSYIRNTVVLETIYSVGGGMFRQVDFIPRFTATDYTFKAIEIHRYVEVLQGHPRVQVIFDPRFNYGRGTTRVRQTGRRDSLLAFHEDTQEEMFFYTNLDHQAILEGECIELPEKAFFILSYNIPNSQSSLAYCQDMMNRTIHYWRDWVRHCYLPPQYQKEIIRSALTLKMLVYEETGAVIAAPTTSIPEIIGGDRNWDYRYCWLRDSFFICDALNKLSQFDELEGFIGYLKSILVGKMEEQQHIQFLRPLYNIYGRPVPDEEVLSHWRGYANSQPVRIGNNATTHFQNDIYGELVQALYPLFFDERVVRDDMAVLWELVRQLVDLAILKFPEEDNGIWEFRNVRRHYTFSKLMCWVAIDRGIGIAEHLNRPEAQRWLRLRNWMRDDILSRAWNPTIGAFTQSYGSNNLDASLLLMPIYGFIPAQDPRMLSTIVQSAKHLMRNGLMFRYVNADDFGLPENAFTICTFWLIDALVLAGEIRQAQYYFENILQYGNHVGLFSEDVDMRLNDLAGNFPQGYTHVAIINTAMLLNRHLNLL